MKKILSRLALAGGTLGVIIAGAAAFSAFEAHVVNVTATIENALTVPVEQDGLTFGEMFPQEIGHVTLPISLSASFLTEERVDDVEYIIRQKPKCGILAITAQIDVATGTPVSYSGFTQVTDGPDGTFVCPVGSVQLPLLCPYLSKNELNDAGAPTGNGISAFHGLPGPWTLATTIATQVSGRLSKIDGDLTDSWDIDLHTPCFKGQCAQDWASFVHETNASVTDPSIYQADPADEHQMFGCDLWVEITNISLPPDGGPDVGNLTVIKQVVGSDAPASSFALFVDGASVTTGVATTTSVGNHQVSEGPHDGFVLSFEGNCTSTGLVTVSTSTSATCIVKNTFVPPTTTDGLLTVTKVVVGTTTPISNFSLFVDGALVTSGSATTTHAGAHVVSEGPHAGFDSAITGDCDAGGNVTVSTSTPASCTITNTVNTGNLIVHKVVVTKVAGTTTEAGDFQMTVDGNNVVQDAPNPVTPGNHTVGEVANPNYTATFSAECPAGVANVPAGQTVTCTVTNTQKFATLTINKVVNNTHGGNNIAANFSLFASGEDATTQLTNGASSTVAIGSLFINEQGATGYQAVFSGDCNSSGQITLAAGDVKQCTITNNDIAPSITLIKAVDSGSKSQFAFPLKIDGNVVTQNSSVSTTSNIAHSIDEDQQSGYHFVSITGSAKCPAVLGGTATLDEGEAITCTIHNAVNNP